jgi:hypothetical protein
MATPANKKKTSANGDVTPREPFGAQGRLMDFDIEGSTLKPMHIAFLESLLNKAKATPDASLEIVIGGEADSLGQGVFDNQALSQRRTQAVENFLRAKLPANVSFRIAAFGDSAASAKNGRDVRDDFFRAVDVALIAKGAPTPQKPRLPTPKPKTPGEFPKPPDLRGVDFTCVREAVMPRSKDFAVSVKNTDIAPVSVGGNVFSITLLIRDNTNRLQAEYSFNGVDSAVLGGPEIDVLGSEVFRDFTTEFPTRVTEFQSAVFKTGLNASSKRPFDASAAVILLAYKSEDGQTRATAPPETPIDFGANAFRIKLKVRQRHIFGKLAMDSTCLGVRGAKKLDV